MHCFRRNFQCQLSILFSLQLLKYNRWNCERRSTCQEGNKNIKRNREKIKKKKETNECRYGETSRRRSNRLVN